MAKCKVCRTEEIVYGRRQTMPFTRNAKEHEENENEEEKEGEIDKAKRFCHVIYFTLRSLSVVESLGPKSKEIYAHHQRW